jgi:hypothetical protein
MTEFPEEIFQASFIDYARNLSDSEGFCLDYVYCSMLTVAASALGASVCLEEHIGRRVYCNLWTVIVGESGNKKSGPLRVTAKPLHAYNKRLFDQFETKKQEYLADTDSNKLPKPSCERLIIDDITNEGMQKALKYSPYGLIMIKQELSGFFAELDKYRKGGDRQRFLSLYDGDEISIDRKGDDPELIQNPWLSILGTVQFATIQPFISQESLGDGLAYRFDFCCPLGVEYKIGNKNFTPSLEQAYRTLIERLLEYRSIASREQQPIVYRYSTKALDTLDRWLHEQLEPKINALESDNPMRGYLAKHQGKISKFTLVIQCIKDASNARMTCEIDEFSVQSAIKLLDYYTIQFKRLIDKQEKEKPSSSLLLSYYNHFKNYVQKEDLVPFLVDLKDQGYTDKQIRDAFGIPKSTLSGWLKPYRE